MLQIPARNFAEIPGSAPRQRMYRLTDNGEWIEMPHGWSLNANYKIISSGQPADQRPNRAGLVHSVTSARNLRAKLDRLRSILVMYPETPGNHGVRAVLNAYAVSEAAGDALANAYAG
jgi:hypothetical protein